MIKTYIRGLLAVCLLLTALPLASAVAAPATLSDAVRTFYAASGQIALTPHETALADLDRSGHIDASDAVIAFYRVNGTEPAVPEAIDYAAYYRDVADKWTALDGNPAVLVLSTYEEWYDFTDDAHEHIERYQFTSMCEFDTHSLLVIPMEQRDRYVTAVTADEETLYISTVAVSDPTVAVFDRTAYAFVTVSKEDLEGRTPRLLTYTDENAVYVDPEETIFNNYHSLSYAPGTCNGEHNRTMVFQSVGDCDAFIDAHLPATDYPSYDAIKQLLTDEFAAYDEAFFEDHVLLRVVYNASSSGFSTENIAYCATEDRLLITRTQQVPMNGDALLLAIGENVAYAPVLKEHYHGQEIVLIERNRSRNVDYLTVYENDEAPPEDVVEGSAVLIRSMEELKAAYADEPVGTPDYTAQFSEYSFESTSYILIKTYAAIPPTDVWVSKVVNNHSRLDVTLDYSFGYSWNTTAPDVQCFGRMLVAVPAADVTEATSVKLHEREVDGDTITIL